MMYFSNTYAESQEKFRALVTQNDGRLHVCEHATAKGPDDESLTVDWAVFGNSSAQKVFLSLNGIHGNESYAGAASQLQLIDSGALKTLPDNVAVILVHNINPYGWAYDSQLNEDGVNLNRNFVDFENLPESDELHLALEKATALNSPSLQEASQAIIRRAEVKQAYGDNRYYAAYVSGQYIAPASSNYGGLGPAWSNKVLRENIVGPISGAEKIAFIDWHTGLGDYGQSWELHPWREGSEAWKQLAQWWGEDIVQRGALGFYQSGDDEVGIADINGLSVNAFLEGASSAEISGGIVEFGTVPSADQQVACIIDIWFQQQGKAQGLCHRPWKSLQHFAYAPCDPYWRASVLDHAQRIYAKTIAGVIAW